MPPCWALRVQEHHGAVSADRAELEVTLGPRCVQATLRAAVGTVISYDSAREDSGKTLVVLCSLVLYRPVRNRQTWLGLGW